MEVSGIYIIKNKVNEKIYIGQSNNLKRRISSHKADLKAERHYNKHLQLAYTKNGIDNFIFDILELCDLEKRDEREKYWISFYSSNKSQYGYNKESGGCKGKVLSKEHKEKIGKANSISLRGHQVSFETRKKISEINKSQGKKPPIQYGQKHSKGRKLSEETKRKIGEASKGNKHNIGRKITKEHKQKISTALKNKPSYNKDVPHSEEHKRKISETLKLNSDFAGRFKKGMQPHNKSHPTEVMKSDILQGITQSSFCKKYKKDSKFFKRVYKELIGGDY